MRRLIAVFVLCALAGAAAAAVDSRLTPAENADPLEPWALDPRGATGAPLAPILAPGAAAAAATADSNAARAPGSVSPPVRDDSQAGEAHASDKVLVVRCRQLLVGQPAAAERLGRLLRSGLSLEDARRAVGSIEVVEHTREYAIDELRPEVAREVQDLPEGAWSSVQRWNGRSALYQVVSKQERERRTVPKLGDGLGDDERNRVQQAATLPRPAAPRAAAVDPTSDTDKAAVVQQVTPEYPQNATGAGTVVVIVRVGRADDVMDVRIQSSTDHVFDEAATRAARQSTYRSARSDGVPDLGEVIVTFQFAAPPPRAQ